MATNMQKLTEDLSLQAIPEHFVRPADLYKISPIVASNTTFDESLRNHNKQEESSESGGNAQMEEWAELHDILFQSVGLERIQYSLQCVNSRIHHAVAKERESSPVSHHPPHPDVPSSLQDSLVGIYFCHDHARCPVIDEIEFMRWYDNRNDTPAAPLMEMLLSAVLFSAFAHANDEMISQTPFDSVRSGLKALFDATRSQYHCLKARSEGSIVLAQTALLLSYWSPYDSSREVNSFWVKEAFRHATVARLSDPKSDKRKRIVWWCCLIRNRVICMGLRMSEALETHTSGRLPTFADFGEELWKSQVHGRKVKRWMAQYFISLCSLSEIMYSAMQFKRRTSGITWWHLQMTNAIHHAEDVRALETQLIAWRTDFEKFSASTTPGMLGSTELVYLHMLNMMHHTTIASLYEQYLTHRLIQGSQMWLFQTLAMHKIKQASSDIAALCGSLLKHADPSELPLALGAWIIQPIAIHLVQVNTQRGFEDDTKLRQLGHLMRVLQGLSQRFEGANFVTKIIDAIINAFRMSKIEEVSSVSDSQESSLFPSRDTQLHAKEDELLVYVLKIIQSGLATEMLYQPHL